MIQREDLERFIDDFGDHAYNFARSLCGNEADAAELVQESFVRILDRGDLFDPGQSLESWFMTIMKNIFRDSRRRCERKNGVSLDAPIDEDGLTVADALPDERDEALLDRLEREESVALVQRALEALTPDNRAVLTMVDVNGMGYEEVARVLDWPLNTVRSRVYRARTALRARLLRTEVAA